MDLGLFRAVFVSVGFGVDCQMPPMLKTPSEFLKSEAPARGSCGGEEACTEGLVHAGACEGIGLGV